MTRVAQIALLLSFQSHAATVMVTNPGFEDISGENVVSGDFTFGPLNGWDLYDPGNITGGGTGNTYFIGTLTPPSPSTNYPAGAPEGDRVGLAFNRQGSGGDGEYGMQQTLSATLSANTFYTLLIEIGNIDGTNNFAGFPGYRIDFQVDNITVASDNNTLAGSIPEGEFRTSTLTYTSAPTVTAGQSLGIRLVNLNVVDTTNASTIASDLEVNFDNVRLDGTVIPEPGSASLIVLSLALFYRRRRR